jgi:type II secretory pathway pseudopilin PulG
MFCPSCGREIPENSTICPLCGKPIAAYPGTPPVMKTSRMAIVSLVLGILGFFFWAIPGIFGLILGIWSLGRIKRSQGRIGGAGLAWGGMTTGAISILFMAFIVMAIVIPAMTRYKAMAKQREAQTNLQAVEEAQLAFYDTHGRYAESFKELGWKPAGQIRYAYFFSAHDSIQPPDQTYSLPDLPGEDLVAFADDHTFNIIAVSNLDGDDTPDVWVLDYVSGISHVQNDLKEGFDDE